MVRISCVYILFVIGVLQFKSDCRLIKAHTDQVLSDEQNGKPNAKLFAKLTPQEPLWEAPVKKSTTAFTPKEGGLEQHKRVISQTNEQSTNKLSRLTSQTTGKTFTKVKRSLENEFGNIQDQSSIENYDSTSESENGEIWNSALTGKKQDEGAILKNLLHQDEQASFGTTQEAKEEQSTINEIEKLSRESSVLPKGLHLPYMYGPTDNTGLDFSKMDISIGKFKTDFDNNGKNSEAFFLKKHFIPTEGHEWETRNRDRIPRHRIQESEEKSPDELEAFSSQNYDYYPKLHRFPSFAPLIRYQPSSLEAFEKMDHYPPIPPAILSNEEKPLREPISLREPEPLPEPSPISEYIPLKEPAPIPELPSLREIPPISEPTQPVPENLNPKETFGS